MTTCDACLRRTALIAAVAGAIDVQWRRRSARAGVLGLPDAALLALSPDAAVARAYANHDPSRARAAMATAGIQAWCRCDDGYPARLRDLPDPPAVLHVLGDPAALTSTEAVAVVGARRATSYGLEVATGLGRGLSVAGVPVVSGMALGIDSAAHEGALGGRAPTVAVLAGGVDRPYPASKRHLYHRIAAHGCVVSELPLGFTGHRWCFPARNRIIAAVSRVTVAAEAAERSGSLITADFAADLGRVVAAVPGAVTSRQSAGTNALLHTGAALVRDAADVLDLLWEDGVPRPVTAGAAPSLTPPLRALLDAVEAGRGSVAELADSVDASRAAARGLTELETLGLVRRDFGGRYVRTAER